jgi:hypothetical protein
MNQYSVNGYQVTMTAAQAERWNNGRLKPEDQNTITVYSSNADLEVTLLQTYLEGWEDLDQCAELTRQGKP